MLMHGIPEHIRSDHRSEFTAQKMRKSLPEVGANTLYVEPVSEALLSVLDRSVPPPSKILTQLQW